MAATARAGDTGIRTRCRSCGRGLVFEDWSRGNGRCATCVSNGSPAAPRQSRTATREPASDPAPAANSSRQAGARAYRQMVDEVPDSLIDELTRALESESSRRHSRPAEDEEPADDLFHGVAREMGLGATRAEFAWATWGFCAGFAVNVLLMKYVQMSTGAPFGAILAPMLLGGLLAGATCAAIGWGLAKLRER